MPAKYVKCRTCGRRILVPGTQAEITYKGKTARIPFDLCRDCLVKEALEINKERDNLCPTSEKSRNG